MCTPKLYWNWVWPRISIYIQPYINSLNSQSSFAIDFLLTGKSRIDHTRSTNACLCLSMPEMKSRGLILDHMLWQDIVLYMLTVLWVRACWRLLKVKLVLWKLRKYAVKISLIIVSFLQVVYEITFWKWIYTIFLWKPYYAGVLLYCSVNSCTYSNLPFSSYFKFAVACFHLP